MKIFLVSVLCFALSEAHSLGGVGGAAVSNQQSGLNVGPGSTGIAHGTSTAEGMNGAIANQKSVGIGAGDSTIVADGESHATSHGGGPIVGVNPLLAKYGLAGSGTQGRPVGGGGTAISNQNSKALVGEGGTGIANGLSTAQGAGGAISNQKSVGIGGAGSTVVADGTSSATSFGKRSTDEEKPVYTTGGNVRVSKSTGHGSMLLPPSPGAAVSNQESKILAGKGTTNIAHGISDAEGGLGGALANQKSLIKAAGGSTNVADGTAMASNILAVPQVGVREARRIRGGPATSSQNSNAVVNGGGNARANGASTANSRGGPARSNQNSSARVNGPGTATATGSSQANSFRKRSTDTAAEPSEKAEEGKNTSDLISEAISGKVKDAANKIIKDPNTLVVSSKVAAKNP